MRMPWMLPLIALVSGALAAATSTTALADIYSTGCPCPCTIITTETAAEHNNTTGINIWLLGHEEEVWIYTEQSVGMVFGSPKACCPRYKDAGSCGHAHRIRTRIRRKYTILGISKEKEKKWWDDVPCACS